MYLERTSVFVIHLTVVSPLSPCVRSVVLVQQLLQKGDSYRTWIEVQMGASD